MLDNRRVELEKLARMMRECDLRKLRAEQSQRGGLIKFVRYFWKVLEPETPLVEGWALYAVCDHLEAVTFGEITRLLINVPPGFMKSLLTDVFWPAWEWSAMGKPHLRYVAFSYAAGLTERDNGKFRDLLVSPEFQEMWGKKFKLRKIGEVKVTNNKTGSKFATSVEGIGTGERGDRVIVDDPHNVKEGESEKIRESTVAWFRESIQNRLNNMEESAIVVIMQRVHETDVSGTIIAEEMDYVHLMIPMEFDPDRRCSTSIGWIDPRTEDNELAWPERFPERVVDRLQYDLGPYAYVGQYQQSPTPRGGSIIKREYWQLWEGEKLPPVEFVLVSCDTAYSKDQENDPSAACVLGVFRDVNDRPRVMLMWGWAKHCELHGQVLEKKPGETKKAYDQRSMPTWGLVEWIAYSCRRFQADRLLIENKASGKDVANEMRRLYGEDQWLVQLVETNRDKVTRAHAVEPTFAAGLVYATDDDWAEKFIAECEVFPKGKHDDRVDALTQGLKFLRENGLIAHNFELAAEYRDAAAFKSQVKPLYDV